MKKCWVNPDKSMSQQAQQTQIIRTVKRLSLIVVGMSAFAFALVPLYDLFCEITGLNGKTEGPMFTKKQALSQIVRA